MTAPKEFMGIPVIEDPSVPPDTIELRPSKQRCNSNQLSECPERVRLRGEIDRLRAAFKRAYPAWARGPSGYMAEEDVRAIERLLHGRADEGLSDSNEP